MKKKNVCAQAYLKMFLKVSKQIIIKEYVRSLYERFRYHVKTVIPAVMVGSSATKPIRWQAEWKTSLHSYGCNQWGDDITSLGGGFTKLVKTRAKQGSPDGISNHMSAVYSAKGWSPLGLLSQDMIRMDECLSDFQLRYMEETRQIFSRTVGLRQHWWWWF